MSKDKRIKQLAVPAAIEALSKDLQALGLRAGHTVLLHSSLSSLGYVTGGAESAIMAVLKVLGGSGTLMMPTHTGQNTEPSNWNAPPVPEVLWPIIRNEQPAFDPATTVTRGMGIMAEFFRTMPGGKTQRSPHCLFRCNWS